MSWGSGLIILSMILLNALFAAYEIALASISAGRLKTLADKNRAGAKTALLMKQNMEASLAVLQLGLALVGAIAAATGGANAEEHLSPLLVEALGVSNHVADFLSLAFIVLPLSAGMVVIGELIPKVFALQNKEWVCLKLSSLMWMLSLVAYPAVWALETSSRKILDLITRLWQPHVDGPRGELAEIEELRAIVALARTSRLIGGQEEQIIMGAARLSSRSISEIMIPVGDIVTLDLAHTMAESLVIAHTEMHTRFPVCAEPGNPQSICGYVNFKDIVSELRLSPNLPSLRGVMRAIPAVSDDLTIASGLQRMTRGHVHIALVRNDHGDIVGMVTLEDILEELIGDIQDEYDRAPTHVAESGAGWVMGGGVSLDRLEQETGVFLDRKSLPADCRTLQDWVRYELDRPVRGGDIVRNSGLRVLVRKVRRQKVLEAQVSRDEAPPPAIHETTDNAESHHPSTS
ncbi:MAG TPA: hemolysin family protein [Pirellulales bacterium]|nr:hemolysin family protein [Pirellulales bacterium]